VAAPFDLTENQQLIHDAIRRLCHQFPDAYWRELDLTQAYPEAFVAALTRGEWLGVLIPQTYGGGGLGIAEASIILEEINSSGGNAAACHAQMYIMGTLVRHGNEAQKQAYLPRIASGELRLQAFAVTEPAAGSETTRIQTSAVRRKDRYIVSGQKVFISRAEHSDLMLLLARTTPYQDLTDKTRGLSLFLVDLRDAVARGTVQIRPLRMMMNHQTTELFINDLEVPTENLIGQEGEGFRYIIDGWNAERILLAAECIGDGRWFVKRAVAYAQDRVVFGKPIGMNQGVQFPLARAHARLEAANLMRWHAAAKFDQNQPCGPEANMAKLLAAEASWEAANACLDTFGGYGFAVEYDVERKFRETRLYKVAPVSDNLILAYLGHSVLGLPKSY